MRKLHSRLPIILILVTLLSVADWAVAGASSRMSAITPGASRIGIGANSASGEPDTSGIRDGGGGGKAIGGSSRRGISGDTRALLAAGIWIRMLQVRLFGQ